MGTIELEQPDTAIIARVSGVDRREDGYLLVGDASESNVKVFDPSGRLVRVIGRSGRGPGEFGQPRFPRFGAGRRLYVADGLLNNVSVFDSSGRFLKRLDLPQFSPIMGFGLVAGGEYAITAGYAGDSVLYLVDSTGSVMRRYLNLAGIRPEGAPNDPIWKILTQHWLGVAGDTAFVVSTLSDSIWTTNLVSGETKASRLGVPEYVQPSLPTQPMREARRMMEWQRGFHIAAAIWVDSGRIVLPFVKGVLNYGDPMVLVIRSRDGQWKALDNAPPPVLAKHGLLFCLQSPNQSRVVLGVYKWR